MFQRCSKTAQRCHSCLGQALSLFTSSTCAQSFQLLPSQTVRSHFEWSMFPRLFLVSGLRRSLLPRWIDRWKFFWTLIPYLLPNDLQHFIIHQAVSFWIEMQALEICECQQDHICMSAYHLGGDFAGPHSFPRLLILSMVLPPSTQLWS